MPLKQSRRSRRSRRTTRRSRTNRRRNRQRGGRRVHMFHPEMVLALLEHLEQDAKRNDGPGMGLGFLEFRDAHHTPYDGKNASFTLRPPFCDLTLRKHPHDPSFGMVQIQANELNRSPSLYNANNKEFSSPGTAEQRAVHEIKFHVDPVTGVITTTYNKTSDYGGPMNLSAANFWRPFEAVLLSHVVGCVVEEEEVLPE